MDNAGNKSRVESTLIEVKDIPQTLVSGIGSSSLLNRGVIVTPASGIVIRYEIGTSDMPPKEPGPSSPVMMKPITVDVTRGETKTFILVVKGFVSMEDISGFKAESYTFTIDRTPPQVPEMIGVTDSAHYQRMSSSLSPNRRIRCTSAWNPNLPPEQAGISPFTRNRYGYPPPREPLDPSQYGLTRLTPPGTGVPLRSSETVTIDKEMIYVSRRGMTATRERGHGASYPAGCAPCGRNGAEENHPAFKRNSLVDEGVVIRLIWFSKADSTSKAGNHRRSLLDRHAVKMVFDRHASFSDKRGSLSLRNLSISDSHIAAPYLIAISSGKVLLERLSVTRKTESRPV
jgi:hypothetical protein